MPPAVYQPYAGLFEKVTGDGVDVLCGAGVGGGSLGDGVMLQQAGAVFERVMPPEVDNRLRTTAATASLPEAVRENEEVGPVYVSTWALPSGVAVGR